MPLSYGTPPSPPGMTSRPDAPAPMRRRGPRPLMLHLVLGTNATAFAAGSPNSSSASPNAGIPDPALLAGIAAYRRHPYVRMLDDPPVLWTEGESRLLDYGGSGPVVLFVPSLINRAYVLDLAPERSMLRWLAARGVHPVLLDWGWPGPAERQFTLTDYVAGRLERAIEATPGPVVLAGYCMGGLLTMAAAQRRPDRVSALALLATPWDFHAANPAIAGQAMTVLQAIGPMLAAGTLPIDALQSLFALQDPGGVAAKYRTFAALDQASERARMFVAIEDWLADGVPLAAPVARECFGGWYGANSTARGAWRIAGQVVDPAALRLPSLVATPARDRIVPPESAQPLAELIPGAAHIQPKAGHVGMVAGGRAESQLWQPLLDWLHGLQATMSVSGRK
ncbi:MAG: alpha/beta fold hydrolase [Acetobacteraceae bacterium]